MLRWHEICCKMFTFQNEERFRELAEDAYDVISVLTESRELEEVKEWYRDKRR
ncbi:hypothetical protein [Hungatella hathewayi]